MNLLKIGEGIEHKEHLLLFDTPTIFRIVSLTPTSNKSASCPKLIWILNLRDE